MNAEIKRGGKNWHKSGGRFRHNAPSERRRALGRTAIKGSAAPIVRDKVAPAIDPLSSSMLRSLRPLRSERSNQRPTRKMPRTSHSLLFLISFAFLLASFASPQGAARAQTAEENQRETGAQGGSGAATRAGAGADDDEGLDEEELYDEEDLFDEDELFDEEDEQDESAEREALDEEDDLPLATAEEAESLLEEAAPDAPDMTRRRWTALKPVLTLHGYLRTRGE